MNNPNTPTGVNAPQEPTTSEKVDAVLGGMASQETKLTEEETQFGTFQPYKHADGNYFFKMGRGQIFQSGSLDALRYHWFVDKSGGFWEGAHGSIERLSDARRAAEAGEECPVHPDPREEAKEWGINSPY